MPPSEYNSLKFVVIKLSPWFNLEIAFLSTSGEENPIFSSSGIAGGSGPPGVYPTIFGMAHDRGSAFYPSPGVPAVYPT